MKIEQIKKEAKVLGKFLDQTALVKKMYDTMPYVLTASAAGYGVYDTFYKTPKEERKEKAVKNLSVLTFTVLSALVATRGVKVKGKDLFEGIIELPYNNEKGLDFMLNLPLNEKSKELTKKVKDGKILKPKEIKSLMNNLKEDFGEEDLIKNIIPDSAGEEPFADLIKLSKLGLIPVLGGIIGGTIGDKLAGENLKETFPNKVKEGTYQYLNNIALCNIGAGLGALMMNAMGVKSKGIRVFAMLTGVIGVGLIMGSKIANFVGKNFIDNLFNKNKEKKPLKEAFRDLNSERHPEALDVGLHVDDVASVGFASGFKWIGPVLPMLYSISAYRAGIGYRNGNTKTNNKEGANENG